MIFLNAIFFAILINWIINLNQFYQIAETKKQKIAIVILSLIVGFGLGLLAVW